MTLIEEGDLWADIRTPAVNQGRSAVFLDRDGTLIELVDYLSDPSGVILIPETLSEVRKANEAGEAVVIVTNQSGIGRGHYGWDAFHEVQARIYELLLQAGATVDATYACPHPPSNVGGPRNSRFRKPAPGMLIRAAQDLNLDLSTSRIMGDSVSDLAAGKGAGLPTGLLVADGYGGRDVHIATALADGAFEVILR